MKMEISLGLFPDNSYDPIFPAGTRLEPESVIGGVGGASKEPERDERDERDARDARDTQGTHGARVFIQYIAGSLAQCTAFGGWSLLRSLPSQRRPGRSLAPFPAFTGPLHAVAFCS